MTDVNSDGTGAREQLSALADGELGGDAAQRACALWRDDPGHRATWHAYHLIGDVMRSDDLACDAARDRDFLGALRLRLADEPVVLAPPPAEASVPAAAGFGSAQQAGRRGWRTSAAVAAGFVAVAGVLVAMRGAGPLPAAELASPIAQTSTPPAATPAAAVTPVAAAAVPATAAEPAAPQQSLMASGQLIRDAQLDRYLAAHKQFAGTSALGVPSAFLRSATADATNR
jgi:sigma-E factor negative regulatory protein RseA